MNQNDVKSYTEGKPDILYKYRSWSNYNRNILIHNELYLPSPIMFNDPFDSSVPLIPKVSEDILLSKIKEKLRKDYPTFKKETIHKKAKEHIVKKDFFDENYYLNQLEEMRINNYGVSSLSADYKSLLIWSHYAESHKGICVGLDIKYIEDRIYPQLQKSGIDRKNIWCYKVKYNDIYPDLYYHICDPENDQRPADEIALDALQRMLNKSLDWEYEHEWRLYDTTLISIFGQTIAVMNITCPGLIIGTWAEMFGPIGFSFDFGETGIVGCIIDGVTYGTVPTSDEQLPVIKKLSISAYPNPFRQSVSIRTNDKSGSAMNYAIYNLKGQIVRSWHDVNADEIVWDGRDASGNGASSGIYFIQAADKTHTAVSKLLRID